MIKTKALTYSSFSSILIPCLLFILSASTYSQMKYDVKMLINEKVLFKNCVLDGTKLFVSLEELALKIDGSITIEAPYKIGPYFNLKDSEVSLIKTGSADYSELNVKKTGVLSSEVKIIILDSKKHAFIPFEEFVSAVGGSWEYNENTGIYGVTVGGCGACFIEVLS